LATSGDHNLAVDNIGPDPLWLARRGIRPKQFMATGLRPHHD